MLTCGICAHCCGQVASLKIDHLPGCQRPAASFVTLAHSVALGLTLWLRRCSMLGRLVGKIVAIIQVDIFAMPREQFHSKRRHQ